MANPQLKNGYTKIVNVLLESIYQTNFTATELKILLFIIRYTYGFNRKEHELSLTFISKGIGVSKRYTSSSMNTLINDNILKVPKEHTDKSSRVIKINKNFDEWLNRTTVQQMKHSSTGEEEIITTDEVQFHSTDDTQFITPDEVQFHQEIKYINKDLNKDIKKEELPFYLDNDVIINKFEYDSFEMLCVETIINSCLELYPNSKVPSTYSEKEKWAIEIEKMKRLDKRKEEEIRQALEFAIKDSFWKGNIRSTKKFREKFETLYIQSTQKRTGNQTNKGKQLQEQFVDSMKGWLNDTAGLC